MSARAYLRDLTREAHDRVDALFAGYDLSDDDHYRRFLTAHAAAYLPIEAALDEAGAGTIIEGWAQRRRSSLLQQDLAVLGLPVPDPVETPAFTGDAAVAGAAYVLEGSRLGGAVLKEQLKPDAPRSFLDAPSEKGGWPRFIAEIERILYSRVRQEQAGEAALSTFACFELAAR